MKSKATKQLKNSTRLMSDVYFSGSLSMSKRISLLEQIYLNLEILRSEMTTLEYTKEFDELESQINSIVNKLASKSFLTELLEKINNLPIFSAK